MPTKQLRIQFILPKKKKRRISSQQAGGANYRQKRSGSVLVGNTDLNVAVTTVKFIHVAEEGKKKLTQQMI